MKDLKQIGIKIAIIYFSLSVLFTILVIGAHSIPHSSIENNVDTSIALVKSEGVYPEFLNDFMYRMDNYTDGLMLNIANCADDKHPVHSAMVVPTSLENQTEGYGRYWHGNQVLLRPLLVVMDYVKIRRMNTALFSLLIAYSVYLICMKISKSVAIAWLGTLTLIDFAVIPYSMQYSCCFYIGILGMIAVLKFGAFSKDIVAASCFFFIIGAMTSFFDLLTTPQLTLGFPLVMMMLLHPEKENKCGLVVAFSIAWAIGYGGLWASKWLIGTILTGGDFFAEAFSQVQYRVNGDHSGANFCTIQFFRKSWMLLCVAIISIVFLYYKRHKTYKVIKQNNWILLIAAIPLAWFLVIRNHSLVHFPFTWRAFTLSIFCILIYMSKTIRWSETKS